MTPAEKRVWEQMERQASTMTPAVRAAIFTLWQEARGAVSDAELLRLIGRGDVQGIVDALLAAMQVASAAQPFRDALRTGYQRTARAALRTLPLPRAATINVAFDFLNPRVVEAIRTLESRALDSLTDEVAATVRQVVERGITAGVHPRTLVPELRAAIGLAPNQEQAVANFRAALESGDFAKARGYQLRDRRFDAALRRAETLTADRIAQMTDAYRRKALAMNAATHARTAALDASRLGQRASWEAAIASNDLDRSRLTKRWVTTIDGRQRPTHHAMHGTTIPFDARFPVDGGVLVPGENTYNCFVADTPVEGAFVGGLKARYAGPLREIVTGRGHRLTVTANHPILTAQGWMPAHGLREGMNLFSQGRRVEPTLPDAGGVYDQHRPLRIEEVFHALAANRPLAARSVGRLDLHGDAQFGDGRIDIVGSDADLLHESSILGPDRLDHGMLRGPDSGETAHHGLRATDAHGEGIAHSASSGVRDGESSMARVGVKPPPLHPLSIGAAAHWHTELGEASKQDIATVPGFTRELLEASAGAIALDEIVEIRDFDAPQGTHVYDLQSVTGWILAGGIVSSNCRCALVYRYRAA